MKSHPPFLFVNGLDQQMFDLRFNFLKGLIFSPELKHNYINSTYWKLMLDLVKKNPLYRGIFISKETNMPKLLGLEDGVTAEGETFRVYHPNGFSKEDILQVTSLFEASSSEDMLDKAFTIALNVIERSTRDKKVFFSAPIVDDRADVMDRKILNITQAYQQYEYDSGYFIFDVLPFIPIFSFWERKDQFTHKGYHLLNVFHQKLIEAKIFDIAFFTHNFRDSEHCISELELIQSQEIGWTRLSPSFKFTAVEESK